LQKNSSFDVILPYSTALFYIGKLLSIRRMVSFFQKLTNYMKFIFTLFLFYAIAAQVSAQTDTLPPAPDFTITTSDSIRRQLYADYLSQGKTVVLYVFFIDCPVCQELEPLLTPLYHEWGNGTAGVEFLSLSTQFNDHNQDLNTFIGMVEHPFLAAGSDGGSLEAIEPYTNGKYGLFIGTPLFVVIAPNGNVTYDPKGESLEATIDALNQAILNTGVEKPAVAFQHSGSITFPNGNGVANAKVKVRNTDTDFTTTDSTGAFQFETSLIARKNYSIQLEKEGSILSGITTLDVVKLQRHILGIEPFTSPYQLIAADVDRSGTISVSDVILLRKLVLNLETTLPNSSWIFINANYTFGNPEAPFFEVYTGDASAFPYKPLSKEVAPFKIIAIKIGDVNFSAT